ncbi:MAG: 16S rRNA (adenine(1518)-N(6)/adenine(1519)-N(6))-dimethyltransferase RsmA [Chloroflexota bacterium]
MTRLSTQRDAVSGCATSRPSQVRKLLKRLGLRARKRWGQHFLVDTSVLRKTISAAELAPDDTVVEVGPGLGVLTEELLKRAGEVFAIEVDSGLASALSHTFAGHSNLTVVNANVLEVEAQSLFRQHRSTPGYKVVANLPYYITAPTLRHFLEASLKPHLMVVMVQKEVAQNIVAARGKTSLLSIAVQFYGRPTIVSYVPASSFYPTPKVDSALLKIEVYPEPAVDVADPHSFFQTVQAGFSAPRKQLHNALTLGLKISPGDAAALLEEAGIAPSRRAGTLSLDDWTALHRLALTKCYLPRC